jgi:hypothetical protein
MASQLLKKLPTSYGAREFILALLYPTRNQINTVNNITAYLFDINLNPWYIAM